MLGKFEGNREIDLPVVQAAYESVLDGFSDETLYDAHPDTGMQTTWDVVTLSDQRVIIESDSQGFVLLLASTTDKPIHNVMTFQETLEYIRKIDAARYDDYRAEPFGR
jgi:hypothetical protein|tara:strand:+ start:221 stop:544 length:324 start_codon:yes stop_codon:yes gene_type:complete